MGVRQASPVSEAMSARRRSAVGRGRSARRLGVLEKKVQLFFLRATRGDKRLVHPCVGPGGFSPESYWESPLPVDACRDSLPPAVNFYRSCVVLGWLAQETTCFILVRPPGSNVNRVPEPSVLVVGVTSWSRVGVRSQVPGGDIRSYENLTLVTVALLSLL
jgi:hypothetical protein